MLIDFNFKYSCYTNSYIGPNTDFGIFVRQAQVRYTTGNFQFAVENPETTHEILIIIFATLRVYG